MAFLAKESPLFMCREVKLGFTLPLVVSLATGFANPGPLGLSAFAVTTLLLSLLNAKTVGYIPHGVVIGLAFFYGVSSVSHAASL